MIRGLDEELNGHKYSHVERERRFLVDPHRRPDLRGAPSILIEDRYIVGARFRLRRMTDSASGRVVLKLSKKYDVADVLNRPMVTAYLDDAEYTLFAELDANVLIKRRYPVPISVGVFGLDLFEGALGGLELAEIECSDEASLSAVTPPAWAIAEVSHDRRFQGGSLAAMDATDLKDFLAVHVAIVPYKAAVAMVSPAIVAAVIRSPNVTSRRST